MFKCRACLATETNLIRMDVPFVNDFNLLTGLSVTISDKSSYACKTCCEAVKLFMDFREKCIESDLRLQETSIRTRVIKQENEPSDKNNDNMNIKMEMTLELNENLINESNNEDYAEIFQNIEHTNISPMKIKILKKRKKSDRTKIKTKRVKSSDEETDSKVHCGLCDCKFDERNDLSKHLEYHKSLFDTQVTCGLCAERFVNLPHMLGHRIDHVPKTQRLCHICSKKFIASSSTCLEFHYMRAHGMADKDAQIQCKLCPSGYVTSRKLIRHVRDCHSAPRYQCRLCGKGFRNTTLLKVHTAMQHTEGKSVKCELCDFSSKYTNSLMLHIRRKHTSNTFNCAACYRVFLDEASLSRHVADVCKHHTRVVCAVCGLSVKKIWLKHHMKSHSDEYPYKCKLCPAQYKYRTGLKDHADKHEGRLTFHCDLCAKSFCIRSALQSHRKTHAGEKPFVCDICNTGFKRRYNLKAHMNAHAHPWAKATPERTNQKKT